jgi:hypothetical protein
VLVAAASTGKIGDGKFFLSSIEEAVRPVSLSGRVSVRRKSRAFYLRWNSLVA